MEPSVSRFNQFLAGLLVVLFTIAAALSLFLVNLDSTFFNMAQVKAILVDLNAYQRLPSLLGELLFSVGDYNPCLQNPVICESKSPELESCYRQALGSSRYEDLASRQQEPSPEELQKIQSCYDQYPPAALNDDGQGMPDYFKNLNEEEWSELMAILLPPDLVQELTEKTLGEFSGYLAGKNESVSISLQPLRSYLLGSAGMDAVEALLLAQPPCSLEQTARLLAGELVLCNPGDLGVALILPLFQDLIHNALNQGIPEQVVLIKPSSQRLPADDPGPFNINNDPQKAVLVIRAILRGSLLVPVLLLTLVTLLAVRDLAGWMKWWGIPFVFSGILTLGIGFLVSLMPSEIWPLANIALKAQSIPETLLSFLKELVYALAHSFSERMVLCAIIILILGILSWIGSLVIIKKNQGRNKGETKPSSTA